MTRANLVRAAILVFATLSAAEPSARAAEDRPVGEKGEKTGEKEEHKRLAVAEAERPITLPKFILNPELDVDLARFPGGLSALLFANASLGASFGITDNLTVRALVFPLQIAAPAGFGGFRYGQESATMGIDNLGPSIGATYRFVAGKVEVGGSLDTGIATLPGTSGATILAGVPVRVHIGESMRLDTGAYVPVTVLSPAGLGSRIVGGVSVPVSLLYDITEPLHVGVATGFGIADFSNPGSYIQIPLGVFAGYAVAGKDGPIHDIDPFFTWPWLLDPGGTPSTQPGVYTVGVSLGGFFYL
jgi:hypothetical protein